MKTSFGKTLVSLLLATRLTAAAPIPTTMSTVIVSITETSTLTPTTTEIPIETPTEIVMAAGNLVKRDDVEIKTISLRPEDRNGLGLLLNQLSKRVRSFAERSKVSISVSHDDVTADWDIVLNYWQKSKPGNTKRDNEDVSISGIGKTIKDTLLGNGNKVKEELQQLLNDIIMFINTTKTIVSDMKINQEEKDEIRSMIDTSNYDLPSGFVEEILLNDKYDLVL